MASILLGWARACQGEVGEGIRGVEEGLTLAAASGAVAGLPLLLCAAAHVHRMAKQRERAEELIDRALAECTRTGERNFRVDACYARARVRLELGSGPSTEVERLLLEALEAAGSADYLGGQLLASTELARLARTNGKVREAHARLAHYYAQLAEGFDRPTAREARAVLDELAPLLDGGSEAA